MTRLHQFVIAWFALSGLVPIFSQQITPTAWEAALTSMPLHARALKFSHLQSVPVILKALRKNDIVKAVIFLPGATDELYFFDRGRTNFRGQVPTLLDGIRALTNKTAVQFDFRAPFLLIHTTNDILEPYISTQNPTIADVLKAQPFLDKFVYVDEGWDSLGPKLQRALGTQIEPKPKSLDAMHFYRSYMAGFGLSKWQSIEALALASRAKVSIKENLIVFENDRRNLSTGNGSEQKEPR